MLRKRFFGAFKRLFCCCCRCCNCCGENVSGDKDGLMDGEEMQECSTFNRNESGRDETERDQSDIEEDNDFNKKIEERQKAFEEGQKKVNAAHLTKMEEKQRWRKLLDEENDIRMLSSGPRIAKVERIVRENQIVLFLLSYAQKENDFILTVFNTMKTGFKAIYVDEDVEVRLGVKEYTSKEQFPQLFIDGELQDINDFKRKISNKL